MIMNPGGIERPGGDGASAPLLRVRDLAVRFDGEEGLAATVVEDASFDLAAGEVLGVLGESGSGKTTLGLALLGLLPPGGRVIRGRAVLAGSGGEPAPDDLLQMSDEQLRAVRGDQVSMIFQEPGISLSPCLRVGEQVADVARAHRPWNRRRSREHALSLLAQVRFEEPAEIYAAYPHQLSGGQRQRVVIAQALACQPRVLIADEPTAALDVTTQARIVALLQEQKDRLGLAMIFISHDPALLASLADRLMVMYAGWIVEIGDREQVYRQPSHPYTRALLRCAPREAPAERSRRAPLPVIAGESPDPSRWPPGCRFEPRCEDRIADCGQRRPELLPLEAARDVRCLRYEQ